MELIDLGEPKPRGEVLPFEEHRFPVSEVLNLPAPSPRKEDFFAILDRRASRRAFAPLTLTQISSLLWHAVRGDLALPPMAPAVPGWSHAPAPSAGGRRPIDLFLMSDSLGREAIYFYHPTVHSLGKVAVERSELVLELWSAAAAVVPTLTDATLLWFVAQPARTLACYEHGDSLVWRDSGALAATICLVAEALDLNACILGLTGNPGLRRALDPDGASSPGGVIGVGGCLVGARRT